MVFDDDMTDAFIAQELSYQELTDAFNDAMDNLMREENELMMQIGDHDQFVNDND